MAASMVLKGVHRLRIVSCLQSEQLLVMPRLRQPCCHKKTAAAVKKKTSGREATKKYLRDEPIHSIYIIEDYPPRRYSLLECLEMHKEAAQPAMTNTLHAQVYADMRLNLTTTKKSKFMKNIRGLLEFPNKFEHMQKKNFFIFSENPSDWDRCRELGATQAGGDDIIGFINQGIIRKDDIDQCDFIFATPTMALKLLKMRSVLYDKTPTLKNGCITEDFESLMQRYNEGVRYKSHKESEAIGRVQVPFGQLNQDHDKLEENFKYMVDILSALKPKTQDPLIERIQLIAPPSTEIFDMSLEGYVKPKVTKGQETEAAEDSDEED